MSFQTGWALVRVSNTGPNITFRAEATNQDDLNKLNAYFMNLIEHYNK
jgi:phosphomannomutase